MATIQVNATASENAILVWDGKKKNMKSALHPLGPVADAGPFRSGSHGPDWSPPSRANDAGSTMRVAYRAVSGACGDGQCTPGGKPLLASSCSTTSGLNPPPTPNVPLNQ
jgi:hypothetical protein